MARIGLKGLTYAKVASGGDGTAVTYTSGKQKADLMVRANVRYERDNAKQYADDHAVESVNGITGGTVELETASLPDEVISDMMGYELTSGEMVVTEEEAPYSGLGYYTKEIFHGVKSYKSYWFYKTQPGMTEDNAETKGQSTTFQNSNITAALLGVVQSAGGKVDFVATKTHATEAAAIAWLKDKANIST